MTIRMLQAWNGLHQQKIVTTLSGSDEAALVAAGIATYDLDGPSENLRMAQLATDAAGDYYGIKVGELIRALPGIAPLSATTSAIQAAHDAAVSAGGGVVELSPYVEYVYDSQITWNIAKVGLNGNMARINATAMSASTGPVITLDYVYPSPVGYQRYISQVHAIRDLIISGPGKTVAGNSAIYVNGTTTSNSLGVRPSLYNLFFDSFDVGLDGKDRFYLASLYSPNFYNCNIGIRQQAGTDAGENCSIFGGAFSQCNLKMHLLDGSSEWFLYGVSLDYSNQLCVMQGTPSRLELTNCHIEPRGSDAGDGVYVIQGTGADARAAVAGMDSFIDIDGNGSLFLMTGGWFDINNSGGAGPYSFDHLVKVRHLNSRATFRDVSMQNMANTANKFWTGIGKVVVSNTHTQDAPSMPSRITDQAFGNALRDGGVEDSTLEDLWYISKDTASITSRVTGTNISIARSTAQKRSGSSSLAVTKVAAGSGQISVLIPVTPGENLSVFGYLYNPSAGGITGAVYADVRWANMIGLDSNGVPIVQSSAGVAYHASVTPTISPKNTWNSFAIKTFDNGASGQPCAPSWATHMRLTFNCDSMSAAGVFYVDDLCVSRW